MKWGKVAELQIMVRVVTQLGRGLVRICETEASGSTEQSWLLCRTELLIDVYLIWSAWMWISWQNFSSHSLPSQLKLSIWWLTILEQSWSPSSSPPPGHPLSVIQPLVRVKWYFVNNYFPAKLIRFRRVLVFWSLSSLPNNVGYKSWSFLSSKKGRSSREEHKEVRQNCQGKDSVDLPPAMWSGAQKKRTIPHHHDVTSQWIDNFTREDERFWKWGKRSGESPLDVEEVQNP